MYMYIYICIYIYIFRHHLLLTLIHSVSFSLCINLYIYIHSLLYAVGTCLYLEAKGRLGALAQPQVTRLIDMTH